MAKSPEDDFILPKSKLRILGFSAHMHTDTQRETQTHTHTNAHHVTQTDTRVGVFISGELF